MFYDEKRYNKIYNFLLFKFIIKMIRKNILKLAMSFWIGVGLMSIINVWKISQNRNPLVYSGIMVAISILFMIISIVYIKIMNKKK